MLIPRQIPEVFRASRQLKKSQRKHDIDVVLSAFRSFRSIYPVGYFDESFTDEEMELHKALMKDAPAKPYL